MAAYVIARMTVLDANKLRKYADLAAPHTLRFGGRYLARGGELTNLDCTVCDDRVVIAKFPNKAAATTLMLTVIDGIEYQDLPSSGV